MRLLDRYLFRELLTPLAYCLGGFLIFWISFDLFTELDDLQEAKLHLLDVVEYVRRHDAGISGDGPADRAAAGAALHAHQSRAPQRNHRHARGGREPVAVVRAVFCRRIRCQRRVVCVE